MGPPSADSFYTPKNSQVGEVEQESFPQGLDKKFQPCPGHGVMPPTLRTHPVDDPWIAVYNGLQKGNLFLDVLSRLLVGQQVVGDEETEESQHGAQEARRVVADGALSPGKDVGDPEDKKKEYYLNITYGALSAGKNCSRELKKGGKLGVGGGGGGVTTAVK